MPSLILSEPGLLLAVRQGMFEVRRGEAALRQVRQHEVDKVIVFGPSEVTSGAIHACLRRGIDIVFLTQRGRYRGRLAGVVSQSGPLVMAQLRAALDRALAVRFARRFVAGKIANQRAILLRAQRTVRDEGLADVLGRLRTLLTRARGEDDIEALRGLEGRAAALYFPAFGRLLRQPGFAFSKRVRRPPTDPVNACLSFGYTLLGTEVSGLALTAGFDARIGFLHEPAAGRLSLVLDLIEELRPAVIDRLVLRLINRRELSPLDFEHPARPLVEPAAPLRLVRTEPDGTAHAEADAAELPPGEEDVHEEQRHEQGEHEQGEHEQGEHEAGPDFFEDAQAGGAQGVVEAAVAEPEPAVYLADTGRRVFLAQLYRRLREPLLYEPRGVRLELRAIMREQVYALARAIRTGCPEAYEPFAVR